MVEFNGGRPPQYPWEKWFSRTRAFVLSPTDYTCSRRSMAVMFRQQARLRGKKVSINHLQDGGMKIKVKHSE